MGMEKRIYGPQELLETALGNELEYLNLDIPKLGGKCEDSVKEYLIQFNLEDGKPEDYPGGRRSEVSYKVPSHGVSILLGSVEGHYHIKTQEPPNIPITREDTLEDVRNKIARYKETYKTNNIGIAINWIADTEDYSIIYRNDI